MFSGLVDPWVQPLFVQNKAMACKSFGIPSWSSRVFPSACVCSPLSSVYLTECCNKHFTCPLIFHWTKKHNSAYPQIYFPGEIKAGGKKKLVVVSAYKWERFRKNRFFSHEKIGLRTAQSFSNHVTEKRNLSLQNILILIFLRKKSSTSPRHLQKVRLRLKASLPNAAQLSAIVGNFWSQVAGNNGHQWPEKKYPLIFLITPKKKFRKYNKHLN